MSGMSYRSCTMKSQYPFGLSLTHLRTVRPELVEGRWQSVRRVVQFFDKAISPEHGRRVRTNGLQTSSGRINSQTVSVLPVTRLFIKESDHVH